MSPPAGKPDLHRYPAVSVRFGADSERLWALAEQNLDTGSPPSMDEDTRRRAVEALVRRIAQTAMHEYLSRQDGEQPVKIQAAGGLRRDDKLLLPENIAKLLLELRSGDSGLLSDLLKTLNDAGYPAIQLGEALGISRQAVQSRIGRSSG